MIEIYTGPMFAGKTTALRQRVEHLHESLTDYLIFRPALDTRVERSLDAIKISSSVDLLEFDTCVFIIDEAQFFKGIVEVVEQLSLRGCHVILAGLNFNHRGEWFGEMEELIKRADKVHNLTARCGCGAPATMTKRLSDDDSDIVIHARYESVCKKCFNK